MIEIGQVGLEQHLFAPLSVAGAREQHGLLHRRRADDREQAAARFDPIAPMWRKRCDRASDKHHIELLTGYVAADCIGDIDADTTRAGTGDAHARRVGEFAMLLDADHLGGEAREARGQKSRARTDFEYTLGFRGRHRLQYASFDYRLHHHLAMPERQLEIGERKIAAGGRHKVFAPDCGQRFEHARIQHVPGTHLLFDHVAASEFDIE